MRPTLAISIYGGLPLTGAGLRSVNRIKLAGSWAPMRRQGELGAEYGS